MSWGERSCIFLSKCPEHHQSCSTCNVNCRSYKHDGRTKPDSVFDPDQNKDKKKFHWYQRFNKNKLNQQMFK